MKKLILIFIITLVLTGCSSTTEEVLPNIEISTDQWNKIVESSKDTIVNILYYSEDSPVLEWLKTDYKKDISIKYGIDLRFSSMDLGEIKKILLESKMKEDNIDYDLVFISGDGFKYFKENELLYEGVVDKLPNYYSTLQGEEYFTVYDEGVSIDQLEIPIYRDQLVFTHNEDVIYETPRTYDEFLQLAKDNKGQITYIHPSDKTGLAFLLSVVASKVGFEELNNLKPNKEMVYEKIKPAIEYLVELDKYLYDDGNSYPKDVFEIDQLFIEEKVLFSMVRDHNHTTEQIAETFYKKGCNTFIIEEGTTGFVDYFAMPKNADNKSGALVIMNNLISGETQGIIYADKKLNKLPIVNFITTSNNDLSYIKEVKLKYTSIKIDELIEYFIPEIKSEVAEIIYELWSEYVE